MPERIVSLEQVVAARELLSSRVHRTPLQSSPTAAAIVGRKGGGPQMGEGRLHETCRAAALGAAVFGRVPIQGCEHVCVVASGGNVELARVGAFCGQAAPLPA